MASPSGTGGTAAGVELIAAERQRQIDAEGWTPGHDDENHDSGELVYAAISYAYNPWSDMRQAPDGDYHKPAGTVAPMTWPWEDEWWKPSPKDRVRELTKAGALIAAEIDRLQRESRGHWVERIKEAERFDAETGFVIPGDSALAVVLGGMEEAAYAGDPEFDSRCADPPVAVPGPASVSPAEPFKRPSSYGEHCELIRDRERDRQQIARLTEALEQIIRVAVEPLDSMTPVKPELRRRGQLMLDIARAVLADEEDAGNG